MVNAVEIEHLSKRFGATKAVDDVTFTVPQGEIFGLLGPNGAGKTTTIRLLLDIFKPDAGRIAILGGPLTDAKKDRIGYMPEERGLYQEMTVEACLTYLGTLKGLSTAEARRRLQPYLERFDLWNHRHKKLKELSRGMQQKAQIINTVLHAPELLIVDEPFSALDPINTQLAMDLLEELRAGGATIIMSTHLMHQVETLCDRIVLINEGRVVLYGPLDDVRRMYAGHAVLVQTPIPVPSLTGVSGREPHNSALKLTLDGQTTPQAVLAELVGREIPIERFEIAVPTLDEIFIRAVRGQ